jgi:His/Glu/Gln/Arg/opine family amino acid ABC transporter permease subunit
MGEYQYRFHFYVLLRYQDDLLQGLLVTLYITGVSLIASWTIGMIVGMAGASENRVGRVAASLYVETFRVIPELIVIFWMYYCLPILFDIRMSSFLTGFLALSLIGGSTAAEIFRAGFLYVPRGEVEGARSLGMTWFQGFRIVVLPQAVRLMIPPLVNHAIDLLKISALLSTITVTELMYVAGHLNTLTFRPMEIFTVVALVYFAVAYPVSMIGRFWERRHQTLRETP